MAIPNLAPNYLGQVKGIRAQREENERDRAFQSSQASKNFLRKLGGDVLGAMLNIGGDIAGSAFRDSLTKNERAAAAGTYYPDDDVMGDSSAAIRQVAESRAATELRPQASFGGAAETGYGRLAPDDGLSAMGGPRANALRPQAASTPAPAPSNPMLTPGIKAQFERVIGAPVVPPSVAPRSMESEVRRRPLLAPQSAPIAQLRPMAPQDTREAPGGYAPPRMMPSATAAMARETGYRDAIPSMPTAVRGLAQQAQDVRDERALGLELMRKKLLWDEQQATANVEMMQQRGASATAIAAARAKEADAKAKAEEMRQLDLLMSARSRGAPKYVKGLGVYTPPQTVLPTGNTDDGLRGDVVPQSPMGRQGGAGRGRGGAGAGDDQPTGDVLTVVMQRRDKKGNPTGPSQPLRVQEGPQFWRVVATNPIDAGMDGEQAKSYVEAYRIYNTALPTARKGDPAAQEAMLTAQEAMRSQLMAGQAKYRPDVAVAREDLGLTPGDEARTAATERERIAAAQRAEAQRIAQERRERAGAVAGAIPAVTEEPVSSGEIMRQILEDPELGTGTGMFDYSVGNGLLTKEQLAAAVRGAPVPTDGTLEAADIAAYNTIKAKAAELRDRMGRKQQAKAKATVGTRAAAAGMTPEEVAADLEAQGLPVPAWMQPTPGAAPARPASSGIQANSPDELSAKIQGMPGLTGPQKEALYNREAEARGWE